MNLKVIAIALVLSVGQSCGFKRSVFEIFEEFRFVGAERIPNWTRDAQPPFEMRTALTISDRSLLPNSTIIGWQYVFVPISDVGVAQFAIQRLPDRLSRLGAYDIDVPTKSDDLIDLIQGGPLFRASFSLRDKRFLIGNVPEGKFILAAVGTARPRWRSHAMAIPPK